MRNLPNCLFPTIIVLTLQFLSAPTTAAIVTTKVQAKDSRKLVDEFEFVNDSYYDSRTGVLRQFMEDLMVTVDKGDPKITVNSQLDADGTWTSGNKDPLISIDKLMPSTDFPAINQRVYETAYGLQTNIKILVDVFSPDLFSSDPKTFLGENDVYYLITKKRGILFYYISRIVAYGLVLFVLLKFINQDYKVTDYGVEPEDLMKSPPKLNRVQLIMLIAALSLSVGMLYPYTVAREQLLSSFSDMLFRFKEIAFIIQRVINSNEDINQLFVKVPDADKSSFHVQSPLSKAVDFASNDVANADSFLTSFTMPEAMINVMAPLTLTIIGVAIFLMDRHAVINRNVKTQFAVFLAVGATLVFTLITLEKFVAGLSSVNDFCLSMMRYGNQAVYPYQGIGITHLLGCSVENNVFQQLYVNLIAQNAALKIFNNEMYIIGRESVTSTDEALEVIGFLQRLENSTPTIDRLAVLIRKNTAVIHDLLKINSCNTIKSWINQTQKDVCWAASGQAMTGFVLLLVYALLLIALLFVSFALFKAMSRKKVGAELMSAYAQKDKVSNEVVTEDR